MENRSAVDFVLYSAVVSDSLGLGGMVERGGGYRKSVFGGRWPLLELMCTKLPKVGLGCIVCLSFNWIYCFVSRYM
jgi:hypothetical protein